MRSVRSVAPRLLQLTVLVMLGAITACNSVKADDLVGIWTMTETSRGYLPAEIRSVMPRLTLNSDGTFTAVEFPGQRRIGSVWVPVARSGLGRWAVRPTDGSDRVVLTFNEEGFGDQLFVSDWTTDGPGSPTRLYVFDGDPDAGRRIMFTR